VKSFLLAITEKLTGKEKSYKNINAYELLNACLIYNCLPIMKMMDTIL